MRRFVIFTLIIATVVLAAVIGWDFFKIQRRVPRELAPGQQATSILVEKQQRRMTLLRDGVPIKTYDVALGRDPLGHKYQEGDGRTPEGAYKIDFKNQRSRFHLSLRISYPEAADREQARRRGVSPGSDIMIHGLPNGLGWLGHEHRVRDWTDGCIAVTNEEIEELWSMVGVGTTIEIRP